MPNITKISETEIGVPKVEVISKDQIRADLNNLRSRLTQLSDNTSEVQSEIDKLEILLGEADSLDVKFSEEV